MLPSLPFGILALIFHSAIHSARANDPLIFVTTSLVNFDARIVQGWSGGGGNRWKITNDSNYPFVGREFGGAGRGKLKGTQTFGSGYPYGNENSSTVAGRPFPYGLWPIYWGNNTMGSDEYGPALDGIRPGGQLVVIPLKTEAQYFNITDGEMYYIVGDRDSAIFMMISLVTSCNVTPAWPSKFLPNTANSTVKIENVIQYYRASSFALASPGYANAFAVRNSNTESTESTPLPDVVIYSKFRRCIDDVIMDALAIMNEPPELPLSTGAICGIVFGIFGLPILYFIGLIVLSVTDSISRRRTSARYRKEREARERERTLAERQEGLAYENYP